MKPTIGAHVLFHEEGGPYPAIVTTVNKDESVSLVTFGRTSVYFQYGIRQVEVASDQRGHWSWPPNPVVVEEPKPRDFCKPRGFVLPKGHMSARALVLVRQMRELQREAASIGTGSGTAASNALNWAGERMTEALGHLILTEDDAA